MLDPLLTKVLRALVGPAPFNITNLSLSSGTVPSTIKTALIKHTLQKPGLDPEVLKQLSPYIEPSSPGRTGQNCGEPNHQSPDDKQLI